MEAEKELGYVWVYIAEDRVLRVGCRLIVDCNSIEIADVWLGQDMGRDEFISGSDLVYFEMRPITKKWGDGLILHHMLDKIFLIELYNTLFHCIHKCTSTDYNRKTNDTFDSIFGRRMRSSYYYAEAYVWWW